MDRWIIKVTIKTW